MTAIDAVLMATLSIAACSESAPARTTREPSPPVQPPDPAPPRTVEAPLRAEPFASVRERSGCAFDAQELLCDALREHFHSREWVGQDCAYTDWRTTRGPFAEAGLVGVQVGDGPPAGESGSTHVLLAARIGHAWFPIHLAHLPPSGRAE